MNLTSAGRERLMAVARGDVPVRPPVTFWRHFFTEENDPVSLAEALIGFHRTFGWDWIKLNPRASYHLEDWGFQYEPSTDPLKKPVKKHFPITSPEDWSRITPKKATTGVLGEHLEAVREVVIRAQGDPVLMTVFTPLSIAGDLIEHDSTLLEHMASHPKRVEEALENITETFEVFVEEVLNAGADGLFFATTQWASRSLMSTEQYNRWGRPYDLRILERVKAAPLNLLHVCNHDCMLAELANYPVPLLNWGFTDPGNPHLEKGFSQVQKPVIGGVAKQRDLLESTPQEVYERVDMLMNAMAGRPWGCGPDCSIEPATSEDHLRAVMEAIAGSR
jgi:uroporphyrinogen decarboxylase